MLVLSRLKGERVVIKTPDGTEIVVCVVRLHRGEVRLGFDAPREVVILRDEVTPRLVPKAVAHG